MPYHNGLKREGQEDLVKANAHGDLTVSQKSAILWAEFQAKGLDYWTYQRPFGNGQAVEPGPLATPVYYSNKLSTDQLSYIIVPSFSLDN